MKIVNDLSANTVVITIGIGIGTWLLRSIGKLLLKGLTAFTEHALKLYGEMILVKSKLDEFLRRTDDHEKLRTDVNNYYKQFRELRSEIDRSKEI